VHINESVILRLFPEAWELKAVVFWEPQAGQHLRNKEVLWHDETMRSFKSDAIWPLRASCINKLLWIILNFTGDQCGEDITSTSQRSGTTSAPSTSLNRNKQVSEKLMNECLGIQPNKKSCSRFVIEYVKHK